MTYSLEKGPCLSVIEDFANVNSNRLLDMLRQLRSGTPIWSLTALDSPSLDSTGYTRSELADTLRTDWFGLVEDAAGHWAQPPYDPVSNPTTGSWIGWYGDSEAVLRETLIRACEVCLGINHDENPPTYSVPRHWYLELFRRSPSPWFEGWVTWRRHGPKRREGQVTVVLCTPGNGDPVRNTVLRTEERSDGGYAKDPASTRAARQGVWVVSQSYHRPQHSMLTAASGLGEWTLPNVGLAFESQGPVVVVAPPEREGGVLRPPRSWRPPRMSAYARWRRSDA